MCEGSVKGSVGAFGQVDLIALGEVSRIFRERVPRKLRQIDGRFEQVLERVLPSLERLQVGSERLLHSRVSEVLSCAVAVNSELFVIPPRGWDQTGWWRHPVRRVQR